jgi:hypothetical protein
MKNKIKPKSPLGYLGAKQYTDPFSSYLKLAGSENLYKLGYLLKITS